MLTTIDGACKRLFQKKFTRMIYIQEPRDRTIGFCSFCQVELTTAHELWIVTRSGWSRRRLAFACLDSSVGPSVVRSRGE